MIKSKIIIFLFSIIFGFTRNDQITNRIIPMDNLIINQTNQIRDEEELIEFIESTMNTHLIPGLSISIVKNDNIVWENSFGYANINDSIMVDENTMFILSSVSKTITATALMQLWEDDLFLLDDNINNHLPFNVVHPDYPNIPITFKMLLSHTSGIQDNWSVMPYYDGDSPLSLEYYLEQYLTPDGSFYGSNSSFTNSWPGTNYRYSNIGAALIGFLVEEISNQAFNEYCNENIFEPLSMDNTFWFLSEIENLNQVALPYQLTGGSGSTCFEIGCGIYDESNPCFCDYQCLDYDDCCADYDDVCGEDGTGSSPGNLLAYENYGYSDYPSGQLRTTSNNLAKFMTAYINHGIYDGTQILEPETIELIKTIHYPNINSNQGLIWYYKNASGRTLFGHNGGDVGSLTEMFISFSDDIGVIVLTNTSNYNATIQIENAVFNFAEEEFSSILGDVNYDGSLDVLDIVLMINIILVNEYSSIADVNQDDVVNILDVILMANILIGGLP